MSRIGNKPINVPADVDVKIDGHTIIVKGPKGENSQEIGENFDIKFEDNIIVIERRDETRETKMLHGLYRSLIVNLIEGVKDGYAKTLEIVGTGYRAQKQGNKLVMNLGFSHQVEMEDPEGVTVEVPDDRTIIVKGYDKEAVGTHAANIRKWREPEPYKGKGIKYKGEHIIRKVGKTGA